MKNWILIGALCGLASCGLVREIAPNTVAGFETGGVLGALDGASGALLARCRTYDGQVIRVAIDNLAVETGTGSVLDRIRAARQRACTIAGAVHDVANAPSSGAGNGELEAPI